DGMPDSWEQLNGLDFNNAADRNLTNLSPEGYTNLEVYLNSLMVPLYGIPGDFNSDGRVDAADYVVWRKGLGTTYLPSDYSTWRTNYGRTSATGLSVDGGTSVPEPCGVLFLLLGAAAALFHRPRLSRS